MRQSSTALDFYLSEMHQLGSELSQSMRVVEVTPELEALAARSPDHSEHRRDEPYRRALTGVYARLAATSREARSARARPARGGAPRSRTRTAAEFVRDLDAIAESLAAQRRRAASPRPLARPARAAQVFGFHLAPLDLRQHSGVHEQVVGRAVPRSARAAMATGAAWTRQRAAAGCSRSCSCRACCARRS